MTLEEYRTALAELEEQYHTDKSWLGSRFVTANNPYRIGDVIETITNRFLRIERVSWHYAMDGTPECLYRGVELTKALQPRKKQEGWVIPQGLVYRKVYC